MLVGQEGCHGGQTLLISLARHDHIHNCENLLVFEKLPVATAYRLLCTALPVITLILCIAVF